MVGVSDTLEVHEADAILDVGEAWVGWCGLPCEVGLHRGHAGVDEHQGRIVLRHDARGRYIPVFAIKEMLQEGLAHLLGRFVW